MARIRGRRPRWVRWLSGAIETVIDAITGDW